MSRYLRPGSCLDCGNTLGGLEACPRCGVRQVGPEAAELRRLLAAADELLLRMRRATEPLAAASPGTSERVGNSGRRKARPRRSAPRLPSVSGSVILLGLGALCVVVAAVVFVSVAWSDLPLASRAAILLGVTTSVGAVAVLAVRRALLGSAEVLTVLFAILVALDFVAARFGDLAGLGALSLRATEWVTSLLLVAVGAHLLLPTG